MSALPVPVTRRRGRCSASSCGASPCLGGGLHAFERGMMVADAAAVAAGEMSGKEAGWPGTEGIGSGCP
jgi:hypothetical protein